MTSYSASKFAAVGFTLNLRSEAKQYGINVTALCPGYLETPMHESALNVTDYVIEHDKKYRDKKHNWPTAEKCINHMMRGVEKTKALLYLHVSRLYSGGCIDFSHPWSHGFGQKSYSE
jgi:short-subunit dehydrogenase